MNGNYCPRCQGSVVSDDKGKIICTNPKCGWKEGTIYKYGKCMYFKKGKETPQK